MEKILKLLSGKKSTIVAIIGVILTYLVGQGLLDVETGTMIGTVIGLAAFGASYQTQQIYNKEQTK